MAHPIWPFYDLRVTTPRLELRAIDDEMGVELALLAAKGVHDPAFMPFTIPWTDAPSPQQERNSLQFYWRLRAELSPSSWALNFAVVVDGQVVGSTGLIADHFPAMRTFESGSWLGREFQGRGIGKEMRLATLQFGFDGLGAEVATTAAFADNGPSLGVTRSLGYSENGRGRVLRRDVGDEVRRYEMGRDHWATLRRDDIVLHGVEACLPLLGLQ